MSDEEDDIYDFDPKNIINEIYTGEDDEKEKEVEKKFEPKKEVFYDLDKANVVNECYIDNLIEEEDKDIGFDLSLLKRNELYVNLIHFDTNITNKENYKYYNDFKVDVVGGFQAIDNLDLLQRYLEAIKIKKNTIYCNVFWFKWKGRYFNLQKIFLCKRSYYILQKL